MPTDFPGVPARLCRAFLPVATVIAGFLVTGAASAQVVINSGTSGPISGAGSSVTVTLSGTVQSIGDPGVISAPSGSETTSLLNDGQILASGNVGLGDGYAVWSNGATIGSITNSGRIDGEARGVSVDNDGVSGVTTLTNNAGGIINGGLQMAVYNGNVLGTLTNSGTIQGADGIYSLVSTGTIDNQAGGWIQGGKAIWIDGGTAGAISNAGTVYGGRGLSVSAGAGVATVTNSGAFLGVGDFAVFSSGTLGTLTNSGTFSGTGGIASLAGIDSFSNNAGGKIEGTSGEALFLSGTAGTLANAAGATIAGATRGMTVDSNTSVASITNGGVITGASDFALFGFGTLGTLTNSGTFSGTGGIASLAGIDSLTNQAGGRIEGSSVEGVYLSGSAGVLVNAAGATITGAGSGGVRVDANGTLTLLTNAGEIGNTAASSGWGVFNEHEITTLVNSGTISTASVNGGGVASFTQMDLLTNQAGGLIEGVNGSGVFVLVGTMNTLTNAGTISGANAGVITDSNSPATIGTLTNTGTVSGGASGVVLGTTGTVTNLAGALISGTIGSAIVTLGTVQQIDNAGSLSGGSSGLSIAAGSIGSISNTGSINSGGTNSEEAGITIGAATSVDSINNSGTINGQNYGIYASYYSNNLGTLTNSGTISGEYYGAFLGTTGTVTNAAGGLIRSNTTAGYGIQADSVTPIAIINAGTISGATGGVRMISSGTFTNQAGGVAEGVAAGAGAGFVSDGQVNLVDNAGLIRGDSAGVQVRFGTLLSLVNTGTTTSTGASPKVAVSVSPYGTLGDGTGASGPAIVSTTAGALLDGGIVNSGTIAYGFQIGNQDVTVSAGSGPFGGYGVFDGGTLEVVNGNLTFTDGTFQLGSDVSVNGGSGRFVNQATIELLANQTVTGNFEQTSAGTTLVDLLGLTPGSWGHLGITGTADFAGSLALDDSQLSGGINGGQMFELFSFASSTGGFSSLFMNGSALSSLGGGVWAYGGLTLTEIWTGTTMSLSVTGTAVPEIDPASFGSALALVLGSLGMLERKRCRVIG